MIDETDDRLSAWIAATVGDSVPVSLAAPGSPTPPHGVSCYLLDVVPAPAERSARSAPLQVALRYLITTWDDDARTAHRLLGQLVFAALSDASFEVERDPLAPELWRALGTAPRPSFVLRVPVRVEREQPTAPRVRERLRIDSGLLTPLIGRVLGPGDIPVANARVEVLGLDVEVMTDRLGRFRVPTVPSGGRPLRLRVAARGVQAEVEEQPAEIVDGVLTVRLPIPES